MAGGTIYVINPNSSTRVTAAIDAAVAPLRTSGSPPIACVTLADGPPAIETELDVGTVVAPLLREAAALESAAAAFVIACYSDPGLDALREQTRKPVFGIAECGVLTALRLGQRFGVIAILAEAVQRHLRNYDAIGVRSRLAAELPIGVGVAGLGDASATLPRMLDVGRALRDKHRADVVVMGCAGMSAYRAALEQALGVPVVDPTRAAVSMALARVRHGAH